MKNGHLVFDATLSRFFSNMVWQYGVTEDFAQIWDHQEIWVWLLSGSPLSIITQLFLLPAFSYTEADKRWSWDSWWVTTTCLYLEVLEIVEHPRFSVNMHLDIGICHLVDLSVFNLSIWKDMKISPAISITMPSSQKPKYYLQNWDSDTCSDSMNIQPLPLNDGDTFRDVSSAILLLMLQPTAHLGYKV